MQAAWAFAIAWAPPAPRHCGPAAPSGLWTAAHAPGAEPLARYAAPVLGQIQRINTLVLTLKSYVSKDSRSSPSHAVSTQFGVEMKLLTRASERFWVRDPPMWTRISRFNSCQQQLGLHVIRRRVRYPRRKCEISFWEGDVLGFKSHSLHRTNREKGRVKFHFYSKSSADWMKNGVSGTLTSFFCHISFVGIYISSFGNSR